MSKTVIKENTTNVKSLRKFEYTYGDTDCTSIWKYDLDKFASGPISVEIKCTAKYLKEEELRKKRGR